MRLLHPQSNPEWDYGTKEPGLDAELPSIHVSETTNKGQTSQLGQSQFSRLPVASAMQTIPLHSRHEQHRAATRAFSNASTGYNKRVRPVGP